MALAILAAVRRVGAVRRITLVKLAATVCALLLSGCCTTPPCRRSSVRQEAVSHLREGMSFEETATVLRPYLAEGCPGCLGGLGFCTFRLRDGEDLTLVFETRTCPVGPAKSDGSWKEPMNSGPFMSLLVRGGDFEHPMSSAHGSN
jgi:hypothetical protein